MPKNGRELLAILKSGVQLVCSMRLHTLIYACRGAVPVVGLSLDPKIDAFMDALKYSRLVQVTDLDTDKLTAALSETAAGAAEMKPELEKEADAFRIEAERDVIGVLELISK